MNSPVLSIAQQTIALLLDDSYLMEQQELFLKWSRGDFSRDHYFQLQEELGAKISKGVLFDWEQLKKDNPEIYKHEKAHKKVLDNYGVKSQLYKVSEDCYYVEDIDLKDIAIEREYSREKVRSIQKEMVSAPFTQDSLLTVLHVPDILQIEILNGTIRKIHLDDIVNAFSKYKWSVEKI